MVGGLPCGHFILINLMIFSWTSNYFVDSRDSDDYWSVKYDINQNCAQQEKIQKLRNQEETNLPQCAMEQVPVEQVEFSSHSYVFRSHPDRSNFFTERLVIMKVMKVEKRKRLICASCSWESW